MKGIVKESENDRMKVPRVEANEEIEGKRIELYKKVVSEFQRRPNITEI
jgi:hypothetical protein